MKERNRDHLSPKARRDQEAAEVALAAAGIEGSVGLRDAKLGGVIIRVVNEDRLGDAQALVPKAEVEVAPSIRNDDW